MDLYASLNDISKTGIPYRRRNGVEHVFGRVVFGMTVVVEDAHQVAIRASVAGVIDDLRRIIDDSSYRWWWYGDGSKPARLDQAPAPTELDMARAAENCGTPFSLWLWDSPDPSYDAAGHYLKVRLENKTHSDITPVGTLQLTIPVDWLIKQRDGWAIDVFIDACQRLNPRFGWAGFFMNMPYDNAALQRNQYLAYPALRRHPGINCLLATPLIPRLSKIPSSEPSMPTIDWLTAANNATLEFCGGEPALRAAFGKPDFPVYSTSGGIVVQAGPAPQLGDLESGVALPYYGHVARFFKSARLQPNGKIFNSMYGEKGAYKSISILRRNQAEWLSRFDGM